MKTSQIDAARAFLQWMEKRYPGSRAAILREADLPVSNTYLEGMGQFPSMTFPGGFGGSTPTVPFPTSIAQPTTIPAPSKAWYEKLADAAAKIVPAYFQYKTQDKITDAQIERMKNGYAPIEDPTAYMPAIRIQHEVGVQRGAVKNVFDIDPDTKKYLALGGLGLGLFLLMRMNRNGAA